MSWLALQTLGAASLLVAALGGASACGALGGQSTDETGGECRVNVLQTLSDDDLESTLGFSVADLDWALRSEALTGNWNDVRGVTTNADIGDVEVEYSLRRAKGDARVEEDEWCGQSPRLVVPVQLELSTADGLLNERFTTSLSAPRAEFAVVRAPFRFTELGGDFTSEGDMPGAHLVQPEISLFLTPNGASGGFAAIVEVRSDDVVSDIGAGPLLEWPAGSPCDKEQVPFPLDGDEPPWTSLTWLEQPWTATLADDQETPIAVSFDVDSSGCEAAEEPAVAPAVLRLSGPDFNVALAGVFIQHKDGLRFAGNQDSRWGDSPERFVERFGDFGLSLDKYDHVSLLPEISLSGEAASGSVHLIGDINECEPVCDSDGCSGCPGSTEVPLLEFLLAPNESE